MALLSGLISATYSPFKTDGSLNLDVIPAYVDYLLDIGMKGIYVCGSTGEGINMSVDEREKVTAAFVKAVKGRMPVVVQVGSNAITDCEHLAKHAQEVGASATSANAPSYFKIASVQGMADWTIRIAAAAPKLPFYFYHIPIFTGTSLDLVDYAKAIEGKMPNFGGIKYTDTKVFEFHDALVYGKGKYETLWGCDEMYLPALSVGAPGGVGSTYALLPNTFQAIKAAWDADDMEKAGMYQLRVWHYVKTLSKCGPFHQMQKGMFGKIGLPLGWFRMPMAGATQEMVDKAVVELKAIGYMEWEPKVAARFK